MILKKKRYSFCSKTLTFVEEKNSLSRIVFKGVSVFLYSNVIAFMVLLLLYAFLNSPEVYLQNIRINKFNQKYTSLIYKTDSISNVLRTRHFPNDQLFRNILEMDSLSMNVRTAGSGGGIQHDKLPRKYSHAVYASLMSKIENLKNQIMVQHDSYESILKKALEKSEKLDHFPGITPVKKDSSIWVTSYYGTRQDPFTFRRKLHAGIDFAGRKGTKVFSTANGSVTLTKHSRRGYGNEVVIDHGFGYSTRYAHLNKIMVKEDQKIKRGELIGLMGNTGRSTGTHLHYEVRFHKRPVNPIYFFSDDLTPEEFEQLTLNTYK